MVFIHGGGFENGEASSYGDIGICENAVSLILSYGGVIPSYAYQKTKNKMDR